MKELKLFLKALEEYKLGRVTLVDKLMITPLKTMPAYKEYSLEVWEIQEKHKECIFSYKCIDKSTTEVLDKSIKEIISKEAIKSILKYYGVQ